MQKRQTSRSKHLDFILLDLICIQISFLIAYQIRLGLSKTITADYGIINLVIVLVHVCIVFISESYSGILRRGLLREMKYVLWHNVQLLALVALLLFFAKQSTTYSRIMLFLFFAINCIVMYVVRSGRKFMLTHNKSMQKGNRYMLVVTDRKNAEKNILNIKNFHYSGIRVQGIAIMDEDMIGEEICDIPVVADRSTVRNYVKSNIVDEVFLHTDDEDASSLVKDLITMGVVVHISLNAMIEAMPNPSMEVINKYTVVTTSVNMVSFKQRIIKRAMDICGGIVGLIFTGILFIIFAPIIYIQSPGPVFFKQERVGKNGRRFKIYKFRSMYMDAEERKKELMAQNKMSGLMFKMDNDPRITPIGKFIRKTSIDEFPQFLNILKGDMSLVGTRPPTVDEYEQYELHHKGRLAIKPGLTGMWQVSGRSDITDFEEVVKLDNEYIMNFSISLDIKILWKTVLTVLGRKGSV